MVLALLKLRSSSFSSRQPATEPDEGCSSIPVYLPLRTCVRLTEPLLDLAAELLDNALDLVRVVDGRAARVGAQFRTVLCHRAQVDVTGFVHRAQELFPDRQEPALGSCQEVQQGLVTRAESAREPAKVVADATRLGDDGGLLHPPRHAVDPERRQYPRVEWRSTWTAIDGAIRRLESAEVDRRQNLPDEAREMVFGEQALQSALPMDDPRPLRHQKARHAYVPLLLPRSSV